MGRKTMLLTSGLALVVAACGGNNSNPGGRTSVTPTPSPTSSPTPSPTPSVQCTLEARKDWVFEQMDEWYLFPNLLANNVDPAAYSSVQAYIDALVAPARAQSRDRYFSYITSIAEENALIQSGSNAGFGFRLGYDTGANRVFVIETFEGTPALSNNIDRGSEILSIGGTSVTSLMNSGGPKAVFNAFGPSDPGVSRTLEIRDQSNVTRTVTMSKVEYSLDPVSDRYGAQIINDGGKKVGYINLRTFIVQSAEDDLKEAFDHFKAQGVTELIVDLRYNGGGLVRVAELFGDLMGANHVGDVFSYTAFRASKSSNDDRELFQSASQAIAPTKVAFIGTGSSASASELLINSFIPYLGSNMALIGSDTYGKPVGQIGLDQSACDDRLRVVAFKTENADRQGEYYTGLASVVPNSCRADDDISRQLGDPQEAMVARALSWLRGQACTPISESGAKGTLGIGGRRALVPEQPNTAQRDVPGIF